MLSTRVASSTFIAIVLTACGGSGGNAQSANNVSDNSSDSSHQDSSSASSEKPAGPDCSDGTCFTCGDGICPAGAYCDQDAEGGAACAWLPECPGEATCGCITGQLSECSCDDSTGGPVVSCN